MSSKNGSGKSGRVLVIGLDGATLDLIRPWVEAGQLPTFKRLMAESAWGDMQSTIPPVTPAAWNSMVTGTNQGKHGLYDFYKRQPGSYETTVVNATHRHGATLWELLSQASYRVCVFNVPATYPPDKVNGLMVSGLLTPNSATDSTYPRELLGELKNAVPGFGFYPPGIFSRGEEVKFVKDVLAWDAITLRGTEFVMGKQDWDLCFTVFSGIDIMCHVMWDYMETHGAAVPSADPIVKETLTNAILKIYQQADEITAELLQAIGNDDYVMVVSDHGFGPQENYMHLNAWLAQHGYLQFKRTPFVTAKYLLFRLGITPFHILEFLRMIKAGGRVKEAAGDARRARLDKIIKQVFLSFDDVDWSRTKAYAAGFGGPIFVNLKGREPQGLVEPGTEYEGLLEQLRQDLREIQHPKTGEPFVGAIYRTSELFSGPYTDLAPDLMFEPRDWRNQGYGVHAFASNRWFEPARDQSGTHRMNGIIFLRGPGIRPGVHLDDVSLLDVAPTVLALMGVPIPNNMDGRVLSSAFDDQLNSQVYVSYQEPSTSRHESTEVLTEEDERVIRERLEALGYLS